MNGPSRPSRHTLADYEWGNCPSCGEADGYLNIGRDHWCICRQPQVRWFVGSNQMSSWRLEKVELGDEEAESLWQQNWERIESYRELANHELWYPAENVADNLLQAIDEPLFP